MSRGLSIVFNAAGLYGRHGLRSLASRPGLAIASIGMCALAIGLSAAFFSFLDAVYLRPQAFSDPRRLAYLTVPGIHASRDVLDAVRAVPSIEALGTEKTDAVLVESEGGEWSAAMATVTTGIFDVTGRVPALRGAAVGVQVPERDGGVVISERVWVSRYQRSPDIIGRTITIDGRPRVIVGVMPASFRFPSANTILWTTTDETNAFVVGGVYVRFSETADRAAAVAQSADLLRASDPRIEARFVTAKPLTLEIDPSFKQALRFLGLAVGLIYVLLVTNVAGLWMANLSSRRRELATRLAVGASRRQLVFGVIFELLVPCLAGAGLGAALGWLLIQFGSAYLPAFMFARSLRVMAFTPATALVCAALSAAATAAIAMFVLVAVLRPDSTATLRESRGGDTKSGRRMAKGLVIAQLAVSFVLTVGAFVLARSFVKLVESPRGLNVDGVVVVDVELDEAVTEPSKLTAAFRDVERVAVSLQPSTETSWTYGTPPVGQQASMSSTSSDGQTRSMVAYKYNVDEKFFAFYRLAVLAGRAFDAPDDRSVAVISRRVATLLWPGESPIGQRLTVHGWIESNVQVVGVVEDARFPSVDEARDLPQIYYHLNFNTAHWRSMLHVKAARQILSPALLWRKIVDAAPVGVHTVEVRAATDAYEREMLQPRVTAVVAVTLAIGAILAGTTSVFSLLSAMLKRRNREFCIRAALGASPGKVQYLIWSETAVLLLCGLAIGGFVAWTLLGNLEALLFEVTARDWQSWTIAAWIVAMGCGLATLRPLLGARRVSPTLLMRSE